MLPNKYQKALDILPEKTNTWRSYKYAIEEFFTFIGQPIDPDTIRTITRDHIKNYRQHLTASTKAPSTINVRLSALSKFFKSLIAENLIDHNPVDYLARPPRPNFTQSDPLSVEQCNALIDACQHSDPVRTARDTALIYLGILTGMRRSELQKLCIDDLHTVKIDNQDKHWIALPDSKTGPDSLPLHSEAFKALKAYIEIYESQYGKIPDDEPLFRALPQNKIGAGKPLHYNSINKIIKTLSAKAGLDPQSIHTHTLRHTCCTLTVHNGAKMEETQQLLRHKDIKTTQRYFHHKDMLLNSAADKIPLKPFKPSSED